MKFWFFCILPKKKFWLLFVKQLQILNKKFVSFKVILMSENAAYQHLATLFNVGFFFLFFFRGSHLVICTCGAVHTFLTKLINPKSLWGLKKICHIWQNLSSFEILVKYVKYTLFLYIGGHEMLSNQLSAVTSLKQSDWSSYPNPFKSNIKMQRFPTVVRITFLRLHGCQTFPQKSSPPPFLSL